jgi:hypothetical protein
MDFKIGDVVQIGTSGHKGKIVNESEAVVIEHAVVLSDLFGKELHANGILSYSWKSLNISSNRKSSIPFTNSCFTFHNKIYKQHL